MADQRTAPVGGFNVMNSDTLLLRQIHPNFVEADGSVSYVAFRPFPRDEGKLSAYDGDQITAEDTWNHYSFTLNLRSKGVMAVTVDECESQRTKPILDADPFPEHASIDFTGLSKRGMSDAAKQLAELAMDRGWQYGPVS